MITELTNVFSVVRESVLTGADMSKFVNTSSKWCTPYCNFKGIWVARCVLITAVAFRGRF